MRVFLTGATGFIGSAILRELVSAGHTVVGLARSDAAVRALLQAGAGVHRGALDDLASLQRGAADADGVIHTAFNHNFADYAGAGETDRRAVEALGAGLAGTGRPLVITSGINVFNAGHQGTEDDGADAGSPSSIRIPSEEAIMALAERGVRACLVRLPPSVRGDGDHGFIPALIAIAREKGVSAYVGDGANRWPAVHRLDAVNLFRLALEKGRAGSRFHGVADQGVPTREIATIVGRRLAIPVLSIPLENASDHFGWLANIFGIDIPATSVLARERLGWQVKATATRTGLAGECFCRQGIVGYHHDRWADRAPGHRPDLAAHLRVCLFCDTAVGSDVRARVCRVRTSATG